MALTESGTKKIEIIVRKAGGSGTAGANDKDSDNANQDQNPNNQDGHGTKSIKTSAFWRTQITHSLAVGKQLATQRIQYAIAGIGYKYGDQSLQQQVERQVEQISDFTNVATSIAMGATYGSMGGPLGMAFGAVMMGTQTVGSLLVKYDTRERDYNMKVYKETTGIEYKRARAQINLTTGRLR